MTTFDQAVRAQREADKLTAELLDAIRQWRIAKAAFAAITGTYTRRYGQVIGELQARNNYDRRMSIGDCDWYQREIQTMSLAILALRSDQRGRV